MSYVGFSWMLLLMALQVSRGCWAQEERLEVLQNNVLLNLSIFLAVSAPSPPFGHCDSQRRKMTQCFQAAITCTAPTYQGHVSGLLAAQPPPFPIERVRQV